MAFKRIAILGLGAGAFVATMAFAGGHGTPAELAVKARQAYMQLNAFNLGALGGMAKGTVPFDPVAAQAAADNLVALASMNQSAFWLPDTSSLDMDSTKALPDIWDSGSDVGAKAQDLLNAALVMQSAAGTVEGIQGAIGGVGGACAACHKAFRQPDN